MSLQHSHFTMYIFTVLVIMNIVPGSRGNAPPEFLSDMNFHQIEENTAVGEAVFRLQGRDPEGSRVTYGIDGTDRLRVDPNSGVVTVARSIDREQNDTLHFYVTLEDIVGSGQINNLVRVPVTVIILDKNDNTPLFSQQTYETQISEDASPGTTVFFPVIVTDRDLVGEVLQLECSTEQFPKSCEKFEILTQSSSSNRLMAAVKLRQSLDYNDEQVYQVHLEAKDGLFTSRSTLVVKVQDVQNKSPKFVGSMTAVVREDDPIGTEIAVIQARDGDLGYPRTIIYELLNNPNDFFLLDPDTGKLTTAKPLDRESLPETTGIVKLLVKAVEVVNGSAVHGPHTETAATFTVTIRDVNDEAPRFNQREFMAEIPENVQPGTPLPGLDIVVQDPDVGSNSIFTLSLIDASDMFEVEPRVATGSTSLSISVQKGSLDYENPNQRKFILLVVAAEQRTSQRLSSTATVIVTVKDTNDNPPYFDKEAITATVEETAAPGTEVTRITAHDRDTGVYGEDGIIYRLFGKGEERFTVDPRTGVISVALCPTPGYEECLDFETNPTYFLSYQATDENGLGHSTVVPVRISLTDNNDNRPVFTQSIYQAIINEGANVFNPKLQIQARDIDETSEVHYSIISGNQQGLFDMDELTGEVLVTSRDGLDISNITTGLIILVVEATDGEGSDRATIRITVRDINNNEPIFDKQTYLASVQENAPSGTTVEEVLATDNDRGPNAAISYHIQKGGYEDFNLDPDTGVVTIATGLNYDIRDVYNIEIIAVDGGNPPLSGTTTLTVSVLNSNNQIPYFTPSTQRTQISEDARPGEVFYQLTAADPDVSSAGSLRFNLSGRVEAVNVEGQQLNPQENRHRGFFRVDYHTGAVQVQSPLNREVAAVVTLEVLVTDISATPPQVGTGTLVVTIVDVNDTPPRFSEPGWSPENPHLTVKILEEQPLGSIVTTFVATDEDSNIAEYAIEPESPYFTIDNATGIVTTKSRIDFEEHADVDFTVKVYDNGVPQLTAIAYVTVDVVNVNDMDPEFSESSYVAEIQENSARGTPVIQVTATDDDEGEFGVVSYTITGTHGSDFSVEPDGTVTVLNSRLLDREEIEELSLHVTATDHGPTNNVRSTTVPVHVRLLDVNDNPPMFAERQYVASVVENVPLSPPPPIVQLSATDRDTGRNALISYRILSGNEDGLFHLEPGSGIIRPATSLFGWSRDFLLTVEARDQGGEGEFSDNATVSITVMDVNREKPRFVTPSSANSTITVPENHDVENFELLTVAAVDSDDGENGRVTYHLRVGEENVQETAEFSIDSQTGELRTRRPLDREQRAVYELVLVARDHGSPIYYESLRFLTVVVGDDDDNRPTFPYNVTSPYRFSVEENSRKDTAVGTVKATDLDVGENGRVYYYIVDGNDEGKFYIDKIHGVIYTNITLDREERSEYRLVVKASNNPVFYYNKTVLAVGILKPSLHHDLSLAVIHISVTDMNDNAPRFPYRTYFAGVEVSADVDQFLTQVVASDPDVGEGGELNYQIRGSYLYTRGSTTTIGSILPSPFNISREGRLVTSQLMAEYNQDRFVLEVLAQEVHEPRRQDLVHVHVWIYEPSQLIKVVMSQPLDKVLESRHIFREKLSNITDTIIVVDKIRYHIQPNGALQKKWTDMYIHAADPRTHRILGVPDTLKVIDTKYDLLGAYDIENVLPAEEKEESGVFKPAMAALIALLIVLFMGAVTMCVVCCCLRNWLSLQPAESGKERLIKKKSFVDGQATENPLWSERKTKLYEEQELSMNVLSDIDNNGGGNIPTTVTLEPEFPRNNSEEFSQLDGHSHHAYATIQKPGRSPLLSSGTISLGEEIGESNDYATLDRGVRTPIGPQIPGIQPANSFEFLSMERGFGGSEFHASPLSPPAGGEHQLTAELV